jgi:hypothetical protein
LTFTQCARRRFALTAKIVAFSQNGDEFLWQTPVYLPKGTKSFRNVDLAKVREYARTTLRRTVWIDAGLTIILILLIAIKIRPLVAALIAIFSSSF